MHPRPLHNEAAVLSALTSNRRSFVKGNCPQDYFETPFKLVARELQFSADRLARVTAYSGRRSGITAMTRAGLHPSVVNYASHHLPSTQVSTSWDYTDPSLHMLCAPSQIMACLLRRFRYLATAEVVNEEEEAHEELLFTNCGPLTSITADMIRAVESGNLYLIVFLFYFVPLPFLHLCVVVLFELSSVSGSRQIGVIRQRLACSATSPNHRLPWFLEPTRGWCLRPERYF
jgi:hypothetical protein